MKLLLDEQISHTVAERLRDRGHDAIAIVADPALRSLPDPDVFALALREGRALVTYNYVDFIEIARQHLSRDDPHPGLILINPKSLPSWEPSRLTNELDRFAQAFEPYPSFEAWLPHLSGAARNRRR